VIVDVGCGTGEWVIEVAEEFPTAYVYGLDLSPIQPTYVPDNAEFIVTDISEGMPDFDDGRTDVVHSRFCISAIALIRYLHAGITRDQWPVYLQEILRILKPNDGWAQMIELGIPYVHSENDSLPPDAPLSKVAHFDT